MKRLLRFAFSWDVSELRMQEPTLFSTHLSLHACVLRHQRQGLQSFQSLAQHLALLRQRNLCGKRQARMETWLLLLSRMIAFILARETDGFTFSMHYVSNKTANHSG